MVESKFKVGDKVRVLDGSKIIDYKEGWSVWGMDKFVEAVCTVERIKSNGTIKLKEDAIGFSFDPRGLELVDEDESIEKILRDHLGQIAVRADGEHCLICKTHKGKIFLSRIGGYLADEYRPWAEINEDKDFKIVKIIAMKVGDDLEYLSRRNKDKSHYVVLWECKEESTTKKMTLADVAKALGYEVEIVE